MANKTFIPALEARVGDWKYYICMMKYAEVARQVSFAHELGGNRDLGSMIQRGIGDRTKDIVSYLQARLNVNSERGAALVEYALLLALIAVVCIAALTTLGGQAEDNFTEVGDSIAKA